MGNGWQRLKGTRVEARTSQADKARRVGRTFCLCSPIRHGSDCARALPLNGGGRCGVWGLGKPIRPRFALASTGGGCGYRSQLKEMSPEDSGGMAGWSEA